MIRTFFRLLFGASLVFANTTRTWAADAIASGTPNLAGPQLLLGVDVRDVAQYSPAGSFDKSVAAGILRSIRANPSAHFGAGINFPANGASLDPNTRNNSVFGLEIYEAARVKTGANTEHIELLTKALVIEQGSLVVVSESYAFGANQPYPLLGFETLGREALDLTQLRLTIGLKEKVAVLESAADQIYKIFPVGVGAIDEFGLTAKTTPGMTAGNPASLTPVMANSFVSPSQSDFARTDNPLYKGKPFLRITNQQHYSQYNGFTPYGLHEPIAATLQRTFVSNGCIRTRDKDLYELAAIVKQIPEPGLALEIVDSANPINDHPYPVLNWHHRLKVAVDQNGNKSPLTLDHGLFQMRQVPGAWKGN